MEKENKFKLRLSKIFTSSCKTKNLSEVIDHQNPIFTPQTPLITENDPFPSPITKPKQSPLLFHSTYPSMLCKPRCPESFDLMIRQNCFITTNYRRKIAGKYDLLSPSGEFSVHKCPPVSPLFQSKQGKKKKKKKQKQGSRINGKNGKFDKTHLRSHPFSFSSSNETEINDWFSGDDEREEDERKTETLFSSSKSQSFSSKSFSFSSDSESHYPNLPRPRSRVRNRRRRRGSSCRVGSDSEVGVMPLQGKVKDTFAVVKSSSDPYNDFRTSMVEMIIEKQIFEAMELEQLLKCFLSLNSSHHHRVIVEVFTEILDALFSNFS